MKHFTPLLLFLLLPSLQAENVPKKSISMIYEISDTIIPVLKMSDMTVPEAVVHMQEAYEKETGKVIPIFLSPKAANRSIKINLSVKNLSFSRILQYFCSGHTANLSYSVKGNAIYIFVPFEDFKISEVEIEPAGTGQPR